MRLGKVGALGLALFVLGLFSTSHRLIAQDETNAIYWADSAWHFYGNGALTFNQVALMNWVAGGENSMGLDAALSLGIDYKKNKTSWVNTLDLGYGLIQQGKQKIKKNKDLIDFSSKFGYEALPTLYYSALFGLKSQFAPGYKYPEEVVISDFFAPLYMNLSLGLDYKPDDHFSLFFSPVSGRFTFVKRQTLANLGSFGVDAATYDDDGALLTLGKRTRWELGGLLRATYRNAFFSNTLGLNTKLELFSNYLNKPENIDVNFDLVLDYKLASWLSMRAQLTLLYDDDQKIIVNPEAPVAEQRGVAKLQLREMFGIGLSYRF